MQRVGLGYDVHRLVTGRPLFLGGIEIPHSHGLDGHSDADVLIHAIADALLGAIGSGDIGFHFPNNDPRWKGAPSRIFLEEIRRMIDAQGGKIINIDASLIAEAPKIVPHLAAMKAALGSALGLDPKRIGIKATTNEGMGFVGRQEGMGAFAVALVDLPEG
ncbi:MAG: 2-C-methyl-D-erythritol 2,4-cyclodiphosphate synthase [Candidatus Methylacidiphilales bacterium]|nr:2-C-methyl-D-erythritol 2,4-cyclodiphosphate synthase [Candidatus Methylacidiphilales bacterium]